MNYFRWAAFLAPLMAACNLLPFTATDDKKETSEVESENEGIDTPVSVSGSWLTATLYCEAKQSDGNSGIICRLENEGVKIDLPSDASVSGIVKTQSGDTEQLIFVNENQQSSWHWYASVKTPLTNGASVELDVSAGGKTKSKSGYIAAPSDPLLTQQMIFGRDKTYLISLSSNASDLCSKDRQEKDGGVPQTTITSDTFSVEFEVLEDNTTVSIILHDICNNFSENSYVGVFDKPTSSPKFHSGIKTNSVLVTQQTPTFPLNKGQWILRWARPTTDDDKVSTAAIGSVEVNTSRLVRFADKNEKVGE